MPLQVVDDDDDVVDVEAEVIETSMVLAEDNIPAEVSIAFQDYKDLGKSRSITALQRQYQRVLAKDPHAPVPTTNIHVLANWEITYNWKTLAWEHDAEHDRAFAENRKNIMVGVYEGQEEAAGELISLAKSEMTRFKKMQADGKAVLTPQEALAYMKDGAKLRKEAVEERLRLEDPNNQNSITSGDFFDTVRQLSLLQVNNSQIHIHQNGS